MPIVLGMVSLVAASVATAQPPAAADVPFDGHRSYQYLKEIVALGPRVAGSDGMRRQQKLLSDHFAALGGSVSIQSFDIRHPLDGSRTTLGNLIVEWHPERRQRILLCAHYDTRPFPDEESDPQRRRGPFVGANDGGSGVAVLCELAHYMRQLDRPFGVDFVLFDGEELIYNRWQDKYFLGSEYFSQVYAAQPPQHQYVRGVLLDMVGDADLQIYQERYSLRFARSLVQEIWSAADELGVEQFIARPRHEVRDDHLALNRIAKIPSCNLIDFDYPRPGSRISYWHTQQDTVDKCSPDSLANVGRVVHYWLQQTKLP